MAAPGRTPRTGRKQSPREVEVARTSPSAFFVASSLSPLTTCAEAPSKPRAVSDRVTAAHSVLVNTCPTGKGDVSLGGVLARPDINSEPAPALATNTAPTATRIHVRVAATLLPSTKSRPPPDHPIGLHPSVSASIRFVVNPPRSLAPPPAKSDIEFANVPRQAPLVGHRRIRGIVRPRHRGVRYHDDVVQVVADPAIRASTTSGLDCDSCGLSNVVGSYPERETNHRATRDARALIGGDLSRPRCCFIRPGQLTLQGLMSFRDTGTLSIWSEQIDAYTPKSDPSPTQRMEGIVPDRIAELARRQPPGRALRNAP